MTSGEHDEEILLSERNFDSIFSYTAGKIRSKFLIEIRDRENIIGSRCPHCNLVWVPPRSTCVKCFASLDEFPSVGNAGTVTTYSVINASQPFYPRRSPFVLAVIRLDGADNGLVHLLGEISPEDVRIGLRVEAVFKNERSGSVMDIEYFRPSAPGKVDNAER